MKNLRLFENEQAYEEYAWGGGEVDLPYVGLCTENGSVKMEPYAEYTEISASTKDITVGKDETVTVISSVSGASGNCVAIINDREVTAAMICAPTQDLWRAKLIFNDLAQGNYIAKTKYLGNDVLPPSRWILREFTVKRSNPPIG